MVKIITELVCDTSGVYGMMILTIIVALALVALSTFTVAIVIWLERKLSRAERRKVE